MLRRATDAYLSDDAHPEDKAEAARIVARDLSIAKICGVPLAALVAEARGRLAELEGKL